MRVRSHLAAVFLLSAANVWPQAIDSSQPNQAPSPNIETTAADSTSCILGNPVVEIRPKYPKHALKEKIQGDVVLELRVSGKGKVESVSVLIGNPELAESATKAVKKWKYASFSPEEKHQVDIRTRVTIEFKIADDGEATVAAVFPATPNPAKQAFRVGGGVSAPRTIYSPSPSYSKEAKSAKYQGTCVLRLIVGADGLPYEIRVVRGLGNGLDEKAIEAVQKWKFDPARKNGQPVPVMINVEVQFRLY